jgi:hypothetical protein
MCECCSLTAATAPCAYSPGLISDLLGALQPLDVQVLGLGYQGLGLSGVLTVTSAILNMRRVDELRLDYNRIDGPETPPPVSVCAASIAPWPAMRLRIRIISPANIVRGPWHPQSPGPYRPKAAQAPAPCAHVLRCRIGRRGMYMWISKPGTSRCAPERIRRCGFIVIEGSVTELPHGVRMNAHLGACEAGGRVSSTESTECGYMRPDVYVLSRTCDPRPPWFTSAGRRASARARARDYQPG